MQAELTTWIALLGRADTPTDAVEDYCRRLAAARRDVRLVRMDWAAVGRLRTLGRLWSEAAAWRPHWVIVQYTALAWSLRGFPVMLLPVLGVLRLRRIRTTVVFHDSAPYPIRRSGPRLQRWFDRVRRLSQRFVMRSAWRLSQRTVVTAPLQLLGWTPRGGSAAFIPVGANVPEPADDRLSPNGHKTVCVFGITGGTAGQQEAVDICRVARDVARHVPNFRLLVLGRGSREARALLESSLAGADVELSVLGLLPAEAVSETLADSDVLLFVRGPIGNGRGSAVAALACGLPIVGYSGPETTHPITEAGLELTEAGDHEALAAAVVRVLEDRELAGELRRRSLDAQRRYFSWDRIAERYKELLDAQ